MLEVFDTTSYILIVSSVVVTSLVFSLLVWLNRFLQQENRVIVKFNSDPLLFDRMSHPHRYSHTVLYVVAAFFQETFPESKLPLGTLKLVLLWYCTVLPCCYLNIT